MFAQRKMSSPATRFVVWRLTLYKVSTFIFLSVYSLFRFLPRDDEALLMLHLKNIRLLDLVRSRPLHENRDYKYITLKKASRLLALLNEVTIFKTYR